MNKSKVDKIKELMDLKYNISSLIDNFINNNYRKSDILKASIKRHREINNKLKS